MPIPRLARFALAAGLYFGAAGIAAGHVPEGSGSALQLFSYRLSNPADKPVINGTILSKTAGSSSGSETPEEWKEAYARAITLSDNTTAHIFLLNDDESLYVAVLRPDNNNGDGIGTFLYFDQGSGGQGDHDGQLTGNAATVRNEAAYGLFRVAGAFTKQDLSWNGSAWTADADGSSDFNGAASILGSSTKVQAFEFAIPLNDGKAFNSGSADLRVGGLNQELGLFIRISRGGADCDSCYWDKTNGKPGDPSSGVGWADVRLNVPRNFTTFYSTFAKNGAPTVDGSLSEDAWRGSYRRDIKLTNFNGAMVPATLYSVQNPADKTFYIGVKVRDAVANASDSLQAYFEEKSGDNTTPRDFLLETGAEDAASAKGAVAHDLHWNGSAWAADAEAADLHQAAGTFTGGIHQYEMRVPYQGGAEDIGVTDNGLPGFLIRYHDADKPAGSQDFYWEYTVNSDAVRVNQQATPAIFVTAGWANFQLGAPYTQVVFPQDSASLEGGVNLRLYAEDEDGINGVDSVKFYRASDTASKAKLARIANTGEWSGAWNVSALPNGPDTLVFRAYDNDGIFVDRLVPILIANGSSAVAPPVISLTSPLPGSILSGTPTLQFSADGGGGTLRRTYLIVDGADTVATTTASTHALNTVPMADGLHTFQLLAYNTNGAMARTGIFAYTIANAPAITWLSPAGGSTISGRLILGYDGAAQGSATLASDSLFVDGAPFASLHAPDGPDTADLSALADGLHTFSLKATDNAGKTGVSASVALLLQNGPFARIDSALADSTVSGRLVVRFRMGATPPSTLAKRQIAFDGGPWRAVSGDSSDTVDTRALSEGSHAVQVRAEDDRGRSAVSRLVEFTVRNAPKVSLLSPAVDAFVRGTVTVRFKAEAVAPDTIASAQISVGGGEWVPAPDDSTYALNTRLYKDGDLRVQVRIVDGHGKTDTSLAREMVVDNAAPKLSYPEVGYGPWEQGRPGARLRITVQALDPGAGLDPDSAVAITAPGINGGKAILLADDGKEADAAAGDNVFSGYLTVESADGPALPYTLRGRDALGNDTVLTGSALLDNRPPETDLRLSGSAGGAAMVFEPRAVVKGFYRDSAGSGIGSAALIVRNDSGEHVMDSPIGLPSAAGPFSRVLGLVPGTNHVRLIVADKAGNADTAALDIAYEVAKASATVGKEGGSIMTASGAGVRIPAGALADAREITVLPGDPASEPKPREAGLSLLGVPQEFGPGHMVFRKPVTLTLAYTDLDLDRDQDGVPDIRPEDLNLVFWDGKAWVRAGRVELDKAAHTVSVAVNHFTLFDLAEDLAAPPSELAAFWDANPIRRDQGGVFRARLPAAGRLSLQILDMAGDLVATIVPPGTAGPAGESSWIWDGGDVRGRFAGAGLYVYVFRYQPDGGGSAKVIRKPLGLIGK